MLPPRRRPLDLDLVLVTDLPLLLLLLPEGDLERDLEPEEVELLLLDLANSPSSILHYHLKENSS